MATSTRVLEPLDHRVVKCRAAGCLQPADLLAKPIATLVSGRHDIHDVAETEHCHFVIGPRQVEYMS